MDGNLKTPSPLSSNSNGSSESLLSEINEVYQRIDFNHDVKPREYKFFGKLQKIKEVESSSEHDLENSKSCLRKVSDNSISVSKTQDLNSESVAEEVYFDLLKKKKDEAERDEVDRNKSSIKEDILDSDNSRRDPRARRRARMHASLETSSEDESSKGKSGEDHSSGSRPIYPQDGRNGPNEFHRRSDQRIPGKLRKLPVILEPIDFSLKHRRREVPSSSSMSYSSSPESSQTIKTFGTIIPQLNLKNCQSPGLSSASTTREKEAQRDLDIDVLVEALSNISPKPIPKNCKKGYRAKSLPASARRFRDKDNEDDQRTFRIERAESADPWELKPSNAVTDLVLRRSETSIDDLKSFANASTQVNMRSSLSSLNPLEMKSQDRFPFTISPNKNQPQVFYHNSCSNHAPLYRASPKISITEVIYENSHCRCSSSSENTSSYSSPTGKSTPKSSETKSHSLKPIRPINPGNRWAEHVSAQSSNPDSHLHDRYSVFFVNNPNLRETREGNLPSVHKGICSHSEKRNLLDPPKVPEERDPEFDPNTECFCLQLCNLFRKARVG